MFEGLPRSDDSDVSMREAMAVIPKVQPVAQKDDAEPVAIPSEAFELLKQLARPIWHPGLAPLVPFLSQPLYTTPQAPAPRDAERMDAQRFKRLEQMYYGADFYYGLSGREVLVFDFPKGSPVSASLGQTIDGINAAMAAKDAS